MLSETDGGPAFPRLEHLSAYLDEYGRVNYDASTSGGMSLRDWFAGQALAGLLACPTGPTDVVTTAYRLAESMLRAREQ